MTNPDKLLSINQNIELVVKEGQFEGSYNSKVADILDDQILIMAVYKREELIPLRKETKVDVLYEGDTAFYSLTSEITGRKKEPLPMLSIKLTDNIERIQRRSFFRVQINKKIQYISLKEQRKKEIQPEFKETTAIDLSGGGLLMVLKDELKVNDRLLFKLDIEDLDKLVEGKIVRIKYNKDGYSKTAGIEFVDINRKDRDTIISHLFNYQRKLRRRGMI
ncbi:MAG: PilZ domain-containing protein [Halanaerobiales bacterium]|nr:PilZ domain-containing protein [Halanaerobiales bacterium]